MENNEHFFYVLRCRDLTYYAGYTNNLEERIKKHNEGKGAKYTRGRVPVELVFFQTFDNKRDALQAEYRFKQLTRRQKEEWMRKAVL
ncbi:GIY-YIG nuclease family protein [Peribacillus sp. SCS-155]|uniref:GIY-YIG nuclease family protein n=1 Tax=Peribacillus sedimenti TaxID=3115297 RepID=UPI003905BF86